MNSQTFRGELPPPYPPAAKPLGGADEGPKRAKLAKRKEYGRAFALVNVGLVVAWLALNAGIAREHKQMVPDDRATDL